MYEICRQDASRVQVVATVPQRNFGQLVALFQSDLTIGAAIIGLRLNMKDTRNPSSFTVRFDDSGYIEYTNHNGQKIFWFFREVGE
jgi:hypothetical protein